ARRISRQCLYQVEHPAPNLRVGNLDEGSIELNAFGAVEEIGHIGRVLLGQPRLRAAVARGAIEEEGNRGVENRCDRLQAAGAYAIRPLLILLNLLKSYAQALAQLFLADAKHIPAQPDSASDVNVDRIRP